MANWGDELPERPPVFAAWDVLLIVLAVAVITVIGVLAAR